MWAQCKVAAGFYFFAWSSDFYIYNTNILWKGQRHAEYKDLSLFIWSIFPSSLMIGSSGNFFNHWILLPIGWRLADHTLEHRISNR